MRHRYLIMAIIFSIICIVPGFEASLYARSENTQEMKSFEKGRLFTIYGNEIKFQRAWIGKTYLIYAASDTASETKWELAEIESVQIVTGNYAVEWGFRGMIGGLGIGLFSVLVTAPISNPGVELPESMKTFLILGSTAAGTLAMLIIGLTEKKYESVFRRERAAQGFDIKASLGILPNNGAAFRISIAF